MSNEKSKGRATILLTLLGLVVLAYLGGAFSATFRTFPYPQLVEKPFEALSAQFEKRAKTEGTVLATGLWHEARTEKTGVTISRGDPDDERLTLYSSGHLAGAKLLDRKGRTVHEWELPFRTAWSDPPHVDDPVPRDFIYWRRTHLFDDGDLLASYSGEGDTPYGYGLVRIDADSEIIWKYPGHVHHDFDVRDDESVVALAHEFRNTEHDPVEGLPQFDRAVLEDYIVELSPEGEEKYRFSLLDALANSRHRTMLEMYPNFIDRGLESRWDPLHTNTVNLVDEDFAEHHDSIEPGDALVSFRNSDTVAAVDLENRRVVWASRGFWKQQHDPNPLDNGNILVFDNNGAGGPGGASRLVEFNPSSNAVDWRYRGTENNKFWSVGRSSQQLLSNGNVLVTESAGGRIFEVTRGGDLVWEFQNPARRTQNGIEFTAITCGALRYEREELDFL